MSIWRRLSAQLNFRWRMTGTPWIWLCAAMVSMCLLMVLCLLLLIGVNGMHHFWPAPLYQWQVNPSQIDPSQVSQAQINQSQTDAENDSSPLTNRLIGQIVDRQNVPASQLLSLKTSASSKNTLVEETNEAKLERLVIKIANRDIYEHDFISILAQDLTEQTAAKDWAVIERTVGGQFFGRPLRYIDVSTNKLADPKADPLDINQIEGALRYANDLRAKIKSLRQELNRVIHQPRAEQESAEQITEITTFLTQYNQQLNGFALVVEDMQGAEVILPMDTILDVWYPNQMSTIEKVSHWFKQVYKFFVDDPRESNSEGGVMPAIFGTVLLVILMSILVMPLGVIAAIYLHEYAANNWLTKLIQIAVVNLAGVPSIVYGVFGLGFFVYTLGGSIDALFFSDNQATPTFGAPGLLWSALTLALLTLPVVIVTTQEGLSRIPNSIRNASYALGATKFETLTRVTLPLVSPAIMTGLILAVARAAGEVAPLMLVGVVKYTSNLPLDMDFPYLHIERQFMHLGFHIYDAGFQTAYIEAARPLVYATALLLILVVAGLNLTAMLIRHNLRKKFQLLGSQ